MYDRDGHYSSSEHRSLWKEIPETECCDDVPDGSIARVAEPGCAAGFVCHGNMPIQYVMCPMVGDMQLLYDESAGVCNWPNLVTCVSSCPGAEPPAPPSPAPTAPSTCPVGTDNLGPLLSASDYNGEFTTLREQIDPLNPVGRESQVSLLVGGDYNGPLAAEIEGRIVVLGDFNIGKNGVNSIGR